MVFRSIISKGSSQRSQSATLKAEVALAETVEEEAFEEPAEAATVTVRDEDGIEAMEDKMVEGGRAGRAPSSVLG